jgi:hypothetical protein
MPLTTIFASVHGRLGGFRRQGSTMAKDDNHPPAPSAAANDNDAPPFDPPKFDIAIVRIARLIGRQMAREAFQASHAANDNTPPE